MSVLIAIQMKWYQIARWKSVVISSTLIFASIIGAKIWFFIENGSFDGFSFYGAVFFALLLFFPLSKKLDIPYTYILDMCAPAGSMALAFAKVQCLRVGCCMGKTLYIDENYMYVRFPSQIVEMVTCLLIAMTLFILSSRETNRGKGCPYFFILYGAARFVLDFYRGETVPFALGLTAGSFWSACVLLAGVIWLVIDRKRFFKNIVKN